MDISLLNEVLLGQATAHRESHGSSHQKLTSNDSKPGVKVKC